MAHGLWHFFVGISSLYLWQAIDKDRHESAITGYELQPRFNFPEAIAYLLDVSTGASTGNGALLASKE
jgi:hypothetical protein